MAGTPLWNRAPLRRNRFAKLPPGSVRARGWLREQLRLSAEGLTGRMMDVWPDVGPDSGWLGGGGESWERGPYYTRGLVSLAHALGDPHLLDRAQRWIDWSLASQRADGFFGPPDNDDWWARMPMLEALRWHHEATGDARVPPFLTRYFQHQLSHLPARPLAMWGKPRGGDNLDSALWLYNRTGEAYLLELADLLHRQTSDWIGELGGGGPPSEEFDFGHGVNRAMGFKEPAVYFQRSLDPAHLAALRTGWRRTMECHGQIQGTYSGDEFLHGRGATQGTEFCTIVELLSSFETALLIGGEMWLADAIERIAYNALPAILSPDHCGHQYFQLPNQIECTPGARNFWVAHENDLLFGPATGYGCCAANFHMGWPQLVHHLWLALPDGLVAPLFAPCEVTAAVPGGRVTVVEETDYPFGGDVRFAMRLDAPACFTLTLRVPGWATTYDLTINGEPFAAGAAASASRMLKSAPDALRQAQGERKGPMKSGRGPAHAEPVEAWGGVFHHPAGAAGDGRFVRLTRVWHDGDAVQLRLPMPVRVSRWERGAVGVERGPLVFALRIGEEWRPVGGEAPFCDYELRPTTPWNYGLAIDPAAPERSVVVEHGAGGRQPWSQDGTPVRLRVPGKRLPEWTATGGVSGPIPESPVRSPAATEPLTLIPFGCARLRIAMFPLLERR